MREMRVFGFWELTEWKLRSLGGFGGGAGDTTRKSLKMPEFGEENVGTALLFGRSRRCLGDAGEHSPNGTHLDTSFPELIEDERCYLCKGKLRYTNEEKKREGPLFLKGQTKGLMR